MLSKDFINVKYTGNYKHQNKKTSIKKRTLQGELLISDRNNKEIITFTEFLKDKTKLLEFMYERVNSKDYNDLQFLLFEYCKTFRKFTDSDLKQFFNKK